MKQTWESYEAAADKGPVGCAIKGIIGIAIISAVIGIISYSFGWFSEGAKVIKEEFGPREALRKYEWFKDVAAQLDKKQADMQVYSSRLKSQDDAYVGTPRKDWPRDEREQRSVWEAEVSGVKASYNGLAAEYNAQMAKFNWRFAEAGSLPRGADVPLPREYKPYSTN